MKITFFGTGHGVPEAHKKCAATLLETGGQGYIIDAGCDIAYELAESRVPFESVKAVFITHPHSDHINGLLPFVTITNWYYKEADFTVYLPSEALCRAYTEKVFPALSLLPRPEQRFSWVKESVFFDDGNIKVTAFPTLHCPDSCAFLVEAEGKRVLFSGDLKNPTIDFPPVDHLDAAILEGAHFPLTDYAEILKNKAIGGAYINHYGNYVGRANHHNFKTLKEELGSFPLFLTTDGMQIEI